MDIEAARRCLNTGAKFLTNPGLLLDVVESGAKKDVVVFAETLTPMEVNAVWNAGPEFVKIYPCAHVGGDSYIRALKAPLPHLPLIASGAVNQQTASNFILAGATALGIGGELIPKEDVKLRHDHRILELARRFTRMVNDARSRKPAP